MEPHTLCVHISKLEHFKKQEEFSKLIYVLLFCLCSVGFFFKKIAILQERQEKSALESMKTVNAFYPL